MMKDIQAIGNFFSNVICRESLYICPLMHPVANVQIQKMNHMIYTVRLDILYTRKERVYQENNYNKISRR